MTEPSRRFSSEAASYTKSPVGSVRQSTTPPRSPYHPDRRRLSSNSQDRPASVLDQASVSTHQRQQRSGALHQPSHESLLLQQQAQEQEQHQPTSPPQPPFTPVFALVDDTTGRPTSHHPRVHYIFSDDDPEELTAALDEAAADHPHPPTSSGAGGAPPPGSSRDRAIVVDLIPSPNGRPGSFSVASAVSLSPEWAVTSAQVSRIQTGGNDYDVPGRGFGRARARDGGEAGDAEEEDGGGGGSDNGLMLRIQGVGVDPSAATDKNLTLSGSSSGGSPHSERRRRQQQPQEGPGPNGEEEFMALADDFDRQMGTLRRVVDARLPGLPSEEQRSAHAVVGDGAASIGPVAVEAMPPEHKLTP